MKIYLISQDVNDDYDTYDSAIVCAENEKEAKQINPGGEWEEKYSEWCDKPEQVKVKYIGEASSKIKKGIILSSFNAG